MLLFMLNKYVKVFITRRQKVSNNTVRKEIVPDIQINIDYFLSARETQPNGCIHWLGGKHKQGYGMYGYKRISTQKSSMNVVHRLIMMIKLGRELVKGEEVIHICKNPVCINSNHLLLGDLDARIRYTKGKYKYTDEETVWIVTASIKDIAIKYHLTHPKAQWVKTNRRSYFIKRNVAIW